MHEDAMIGAKVVFEDDRDLDQFHVEANQYLVFDGGGGEIDLANLCVHADGEIAARLEGETAEDGVLPGMSAVVGGGADFAAGNDARAAVLRRRLFYDQLAIEVDVGASDGRESGKSVGRFAGVDVDGSALAKGRDCGQQE